MTIKAYQQFQTDKRNYLCVQTILQLYCWHAEMKVTLPLQKHGIRRSYVKVATLGGQREIMVLVGYSLSLSKTNHFITLWQQTHLVVPVHKHKYTSTAPGCSVLLRRAEWQEMNLQYIYFDVFSGDK